MVFALAGIVAMASAAWSDTLTDAAGECATCHATQAARAVSTGGHADVLDCRSCHEDRRPGRVGRRHRTVPNCLDCHETVGHPTRAATQRGRRAKTRNCSACHDVHGSPNRMLVRTDIRWRRRIAAVAFTSDAGAVPGGFTDPTAPGSGLCEVCHRQTKFYRRSGDGEPHFTDRCTECHAHGEHFGVVVSEGNCAICHADEAARLARPSQHTALPCGTCHAEVSAAPGPGHRAAEPCETCHAANPTHAPAGRAPLACTQCHDPHGTTNTQLVLDVLTTTAGTQVPIRFDNLDGRAEASFASPSAPGTGVCEVCHTTTRFYRADGGGEDHFAFSCLPCHRHGRGFGPP